MGLVGVSKKSKDPLLRYLFVAALAMSGLSVATWIGRPAPEIGMNEDLGLGDERGLASIEAESRPLTRPAREQTRWEVVQLTISCLSKDSPMVPVGAHQHQVQLSLMGCPAPEASQLHLRQKSLPTPLLVFSSELSRGLDSEIIQLREGPNEFEIRWVSTDGKEHSRSFTIHRADAT